MKVIVYHASYGCDTGCCGHIVQIGESEHFSFGHPYDPEDARAWAQKVADQHVREAMGAEHTADLDWENCVIVTDC